MSMVNVESINFSDVFMGWLNNSRSDICLHGRCYLRNDAKGGVFICQLNSIGCGKLHANLPTDTEVVVLLGFSEPASALLYTCLRTALTGYWRARVLRMLGLGSTCDGCQKSREARDGIV